MGNVARNRQYKIMMPRSHLLDISAASCPESVNFLNVSIERVFGRSQNAPAVFEERRKAGVRT